MKNYFKWAAGMSILTIVFFACQSDKKSTSTATSDPLMPDRIDTTANPAVDFYAYANGNWIKTHDIPSDESVFGVFTSLRDTVAANIRVICEAAAKNTSAAKGSNQQKLGDFYTTGMDTVAIDKAGIDPLKGELAAIDKVTDVPSLIAEIAHLHTLGAGGLFGAYVGPDQKISSKINFYTSQGGLGLPERDYYFKTDPRTTKIRTEYVAHIANEFKLMGEDEATAKKHADAVMTIETNLAKVSRGIIDLRDPYKNYNKMTLVAADKLSPSIHWADFATKIGLTGVDTVIVGQPEFFTGIELQLHATAIEDWKTYCRWNLINAYSTYLGKPFVDESFHFNSTVMRGVTKQKPRWFKIVRQLDGMIGDILGQEYVKQYFPAEYKKRTLDMVNSMIEVYKGRIQKLDWMSDVTKQKAVKKLSAITKKIAYPDKWKDYSKLEVDKSSYAQNVMRANQWAYTYMISKYGKPVDRSEWQMTAPTINAYYEPTNNEIVFPAGILSIAGKNPDDAMLYGSIGAVIGHEMTHGFDDQGCQYDEVGNLNDWWTKEDKEKFKQRTQVLVNQFNSYVVLDSVHIKGEATLGENIADIGGLLIAYDAYKLTEQGKTKGKINGYTADQRFFLSFAYTWMNKMRDQELATRIMTDVHSPAKYRVIGPVSNIPAFYEAFNVKPGDKMYRADSLRVKIW